MQSLFGAGDAIDAAIAGAGVMTRAGPWTQTTVMAVGGLSAIGFDRSCEDMLVTSSSGQSVVDGATGEVLYRNRDADGLDVSALKGTRLDHPADERFDMAGLMGGGLRRVSDDGWSVDTMRGACLLHPPGASVQFLDPKWDSYNKDATFYLLDHSHEALRAFGFSWSGRTLAVATPNMLMLWGRPAPLKL